MEFVQIQKGTFFIGTDYRTVMPFEIMSTQVTQLMWAELMGKNPSAIENSSGVITKEINGIGVKMLPDYPVDNISLSSLKAIICTIVH